MQLLIYGSMLSIRTSDHGSSHEMVLADLLAVKPSSVYSAGINWLFNLSKARYFHPH